jgi:hypothetical protein
MTRTYIPSACGKLLRISDLNIAGIYAHLRTVRIVAPKTPAFLLTHRDPETARIRILRQNLKKPLHTPPIDGTMRLQVSPLAGRRVKTISIFCRTTQYLNKLMN